MRIHKKPLFLVGIALLGVLLFFAGRYALDKYYDGQADKRYAEKIAVIDSHIPEKSHPSFQDLAVHLHDFVQTNSQHKMDEEFYAAWPDRMKLADNFITGLEGKRPDKPHMECSTRSNILSALFQKRGYKVRNVVLYATDNNLASHRIIEVLNPETRAWEAYDVTYDVLYIEKDTKRRAGIIEVGANPSRFTPCNTKGRCGWSLVTPYGQKVSDLKSYLNLMSIDDPHNDFRGALYNPDVKHDAVYTPSKDTTGTFCELYEKNCKDGFTPFVDAPANLISE